MGMVDDYFHTCSHLRYRDDFYQLVRSNLKNGFEDEADVVRRFSRMPENLNDALLSFAAGNAEYYSRLLGIPVPEWCFDVPALEPNLVPFFPFPMLIEELDESISHTPPELRNRGFIYNEHNFEIY